MVGPSITEADRQRFLKRLKVGFAVLVGGSMGLVAVWGGGDFLVAAGVFVVATGVGGLLAQFTLPDSIAETPFSDEELDRGPKPGVRTQKRRERADEPKMTDRRDD